MVPEKEPSGVLASLEKTWGWCAPEEAMIRQEVYNGAFRGGGLRFRRDRSPKRGMKSRLLLYLQDKEGGGDHSASAPIGFACIQNTQHIFAPAGILSSIISRFRRSSPFSVWTAEMSMPLDSSPIIFRGGRLTMATRVLPTSSSGL